MLFFIAEQVAMAIAHKHSEEALAKSEADRLLVALQAADGRV